MSPRGVFIIPAASRLSQALLSSGRILDSPARHPPAAQFHAATLSKDEREDFESCAHQTLIDISRRLNGFFSMVSACGLGTCMGQPCRVPSSSVSRCWARSRARAQGTPRHRSWLRPLPCRIPVCGSTQHAHARSPCHAWAQRFPPTSSSRTVTCMQDPGYYAQLDDHRLWVHLADNGHVYISKHPENGSLKASVRCFPGLARFLGG